MPNINNFSVSIVLRNFNQNIFNYSLLDYTKPKINKGIGLLDGRVVSFSPSVCLACVMVQLVVVAYMVRMGPSGQYNC